MEKRPIEQAFTESTIRAFLGYLSGALPELASVEVPRLAQAWNQFKAYHEADQIRAASKPPREYPGDPTDRTE